MTDTTDPVAELRRALNNPELSDSSFEVAMGAEDDLLLACRTHLPAVLTRLDAAEQALAREHQLLLNAQDAIREVSAETETAEREIERLRDRLTALVDDQGYTCVDQNDDPVCCYCDGPMCADHDGHSDTCPVKLARVALEGQQEASGIAWAQHVVRSVDTGGGR